MKWMVLAIIACAAAASVPSADAQSAQPAAPPVSVPPTNVILPNYDSVPIGDVAGLEGGAYLARAADSSSALFNPAGLARAEQTSVSGGAGVFNFTTVSPDGLQKNNGAFQQIPALVAFVLKDVGGLTGWSGGFSLSRSNAWYQSGVAMRESTTGAATDRVQYASSAEYSGWLASFGIGHAQNDRLSLGGAVDIQLLTTARSQSLNEQYSSDNGLDALQVGAHGDSYTTHLRGTFGVQYNLSPAFRIGAVVRTPGLTFLKHGAYGVQGVAAAGATISTASFYEPSGQVDYRLPAEIKGGAALVGSRAQVEVDVLAYAGTGTYPAFQSGQTFQVVSSAGPGAAARVDQLPFVAPVVDSRTVVNVAVGGQVNVARDGRWRLHGGFATDRSPVGPADTLFTKIDMLTWTVGLSARTTHILGSLGLHYERGDSGPVTLRALQNGQSLVTSFRTSNVGVVYSIALLF